MNDRARLFRAKLSHGCFELGFETCGVRLAFLLVFARQRGTRSLASRQFHGMIGCSDGLGFTALGRGAADLFDQFRQLDLVLLVTDRQRHSPVATRRSPFWDQVQQVGHPGGFFAHSETSLAWGFINVTQGDDNKNITEDMAFGAARINRGVLAPWKQFLQPWEI